MQRNAFGNAIGSSVAGTGWGEDRRTSTAYSGSGMSEEDYWNAQPRTAADRYVDTYGGESVQTGGKFQNADSLNRQQELARIASQAWDPSYYTPDGTIRIEISGVAPTAEGLSGDWSATGMPDNSPLREIGQSADGGLIWNTGAVSYPIGWPSTEMRSLQDNPVAGTGLTPQGSTWQSDFLRGYGGDYRSVMEGPAPMAETVGRYSGEVVDSFRNFGMSMIGANSMNAAQASWNAGNYGTSLLQGAQAFGEAGLTVLSLGTLGSARAGTAIAIKDALALDSAYGEEAFSRIVPGGGLAAHEAAGGHLLLKHVEQTEPMLLNRLAAEPGITGSSSFYNRAIAESAISRTLDMSQSEINTWLTGNVRQLTLQNTLQENIGVTISRGTTSLVDSPSLKLILRRDPTMIDGYRIQTGFPTP